MRSNVTESIRVGCQGEGLFSYFSSCPSVDQRHKRRQFYPIEGMIQLTNPKLAPLIIISIEMPGNRAIENRKPR